MRTPMRLLLAIAAYVVTLFTVAPADAADIKLVGSVSLKGVMRVLLPRFEQSSGDKVAVIYGASADVKRRIDAGESFDVVLLAPGQVEDLIKQGKALSAAVDVSRSGLAFAIRAGAPHPDLSTDEKLKAYLLAVKSISRSDPSAGGFSSAYFDRMTAAMGIADATAAKTIFVPSGDGGVPVATGGAELGVGMMSEILPVEGVDAIPFKPEDPASFLSIAGAVGANAKDLGAARALLDYLRTPAAKEVFMARGMTTP